MNYRLMTLAATAGLLLCGSLPAQSLRLNESEYFETRGVNVLVYSNNYAGIFADEKKAGVELILRGERVATGGGIRLTDTPEQWDIYPEVVSRSVNPSDQTISVVLRYPQYDFSSTLEVRPEGAGCVLSVSLDKPVPEFLVGKAGLNLEFFPPSYFGKNYMMDGAPEILPRYPAGETRMRPNSERVPQFYGLSTFDDRGRDEFIDPMPLSTGHKLVLAPEDESRRVLISSDSELNLFDGRVLAQNGTFVVRSFLPADKTGKVLEWYVEASYDPEWVREPNVGFSQIGYTPAQKKVAVVELDRNDTPEKTAGIFRVDDSGNSIKVMDAPVKEWGVFYGRYNYATVDFTSVDQPGVYYICYGDVKTNSFPISADVYEGKWNTTMDVWLPVQMDHMEVNEGYRTWHGNSHKDDALMAPLNYQQFDGYTQGPVTNTRYAPLEHIPGLAVGGWYDAGDFDIQGGTVVGMTADLSTLWETFAPDRDQTYIDQQTQFVDIHRPDGTPDVIQQILHGALNVNAQVENIGFVCQGIVQGNLYQYHHLGDGSTITDNYIYNPDMKPYENDGKYSGTRDDRLVFTTNFSPAGTMPTVAALAAAYRTLKDYYPEEAQRSLDNALMLWNKYSKDAAPSGDRRGGRYGDSRSRAAMQLWISTGDEVYKEYFMDAVESDLDAAIKAVGSAEPARVNLSSALTLYPYMDNAFREKVRKAVPAYVEYAESVAAGTPYGVPVSGSGWGGNEGVISWAYNNYLVWQYFPDMIDPDFVLRGLNYLYGCHPYSNVSFVNSVGVNTKKVAYGNNRADYTVIPGGIVPGLLLLAPDFMENKDDYPFHWGENECCTRTVPGYVMLSIACEKVAESLNK